MSLAQLFLGISEYSSEAAIIYKYFLFCFTRHSYVSPRLRLLGVNWVMLWVEEFIQNWQICHLEILALKELWSEKKNNQRVSPCIIINKSGNINIITNNKDDSGDGAARLWHNLSVDGS